MQGERLAAERALATSRTPGMIDRAKYATLVDGLGDIDAGARTTPTRPTKAELYAELGHRSSRYRPGGRIVAVEADPGVLKCVSEGGLEPPRPCGH